MYNHIYVIQRLLVLNYLDLYVHVQLYPMLFLTSQYFESIQGVRNCPQDLNPATWMLEISALGAEQKLGINFADVYDASDIAK